MINTNQAGFSLIDSEKDLTPEEWLTRSKNPKRKFDGRCLHYFNGKYEWKEMKLKGWD
jgi:hypothetical protein